MSAFKSLPRRREPRVKRSVFLDSRLRGNDASKPIACCRGKRCQAPAEGDVSFPGEGPRLRGSTAKRIGACRRQLGGCYGSEGSETAA
jgi:hypothetical protein